MQRTPAIDEFERTLDQQGVHAALRFLNARAPHRFTGIYRYDGDVLRNVGLVDKYEPALRTGDDVKMCDAYCALVRDLKVVGGLEFVDASDDPRLAHKPDSPVVSYGGVLIHDEDGAAFGTLCHFDVKRCEAPFHDVDLLQAAAPMLFARLRRAAPRGSNLRVSLT